MSVTAPTGFRAGTAATGRRPSGDQDVAVLVSDTPASAAGVFTTNRMAAPPIAQAKRTLADGRLTAVVINAGNANACTGAKGLEDADMMADRAAVALGIEPSDVAVASTGVIGVPMDMDTTLPAIEAAVAAQDVDGGAGAARAIMTTDTVSKEAVATVDAHDTTYTVGGMVKGAGMIRPDMATMLCFMTTDAPLTAEGCRVALDSAVGQSFHRITIDGETSTNDCALLLANGAAGGEPMGPTDHGFDAIASAVRDVAQDLARAVVRDGEGATTFIEIVVTGAADDDQAHSAAMAVADSVLFKCAVFGKDANWGRVVSAVGASGVEIDPGAISVRFAGLLVADEGAAVSFDEEEASKALAADEVTVEVDLGVAGGSSVAWTCDMSYDYVRINADYRS